MREWTIFLDFSGWGKVVYWRIEATQVESGTTAKTRLKSSKYSSPYAGMLGSPSGAARAYDIKVALSQPLHGHSEGIWSNKEEKTEVF
ncbi:hypothetical protein FRC02_002102 [Tulasnella sp. 418]|nr:hypothetical protein FRC02_002102 [Tulasnella sp. 418]